MKSVFFVFKRLKTRAIRGISHISKRGSPLLRWALFVSAPTMVTKHRDFTKIYERHLNKKRGHRFAMTVVAHKLARVIWRLFKDGRSFAKRPPKRLSKK